MNVEMLRQYCLSKNFVKESFPFGDDTLVFKVADKMFALINLDDDLSINLKCDPEKAMELREQYNAVLPGYHMNKTYWNTIMIDGTLPDKLIEAWIDHSYEEVVRSLPKSKRELVER